MTRCGAYVRSSTEATQPDFGPAPTYDPPLLAAMTASPKRSSAEGTQGCFATRRVGWKAARSSSRSESSPVHLS
jgi:hypothetical protein